MNKRQIKPILMLINVVMIINRFEKEYKDGYLYVYKIGKYQGCSDICKRIFKIIFKNEYKNEYKNEIKRINWLSYYEINLLQKKEFKCLKCIEEGDTLNSKILKEEIIRFLR